jgi:hypothetical protein
MNFVRRNEPILWPLAWLVLVAAVVVSSITGPRWLTYVLIVVLVVDLVTGPRRRRWIRRRLREPV